MRPFNSQLRSRTRRNDSFGNRGQSPARGFTLIEALVALVLTALTFTSGAMLYQAATANGTQSAMLADVELGTPMVENFYGLSQNSISAYTAPHSGRAVFAENLRELFKDDLVGAVAVFCLGRNAMNTVRPRLIPYPAATPLRLDTPEAFRQHLVSEFPEAATIFVPYRVVPSTTNGTIYILAPSAVPSELLVRAVYEIDLIAHGDPAGTYASVRRYVGTDSGAALTNYYDIFYPAGTGTLFQPLFVAFEREVRTSVVEGGAIDRFKKAKNYPFYFIWWPDPTARSLESPYAGSYPNDDPRQAYGHMGGRTGFMFTVPLFPTF